MAWSVTLLVTLTILVGALAGSSLRMNTARCYLTERHVGFQDHINTTQWPTEHL
jgi:hypothetical protein